MLVSFLVTVSILGSLLVVPPLWFSVERRLERRRSSSKPFLSVEQERQLEISLGVGPEFDLDGELLDPTLEVVYTEYGTSIGGRRGRRYQEPRYMIRRRPGEGHYNDKL